MSAASTADAPPSSLVLHASALVVGEAGILIRGASGAGKSSLALGLIAATAGARRFARLIGDDRILVTAQAGRLLVRGHPAVAGRIERRGLGILDVAYEAVAVVRLMVDLVPTAPPALRFREPDPPPVDILGVKLPLLVLSAHAGHDDKIGVVLDFLNKPGTI